jgi:sialate O-acetylesterase
MANADKGGRSEMRIAAFFILIFLFPAFCDLWMPSIFGDNMVLRAGGYVPLWGRADSGSKIKVDFGRQSKEVLVETEGKWRIILDAMAADAQPRTLTVTQKANGQSQKLIFENVLVGEVWILAGQSNMGWPLKNCEGGQEAAAGAEYGWLRIFSQWPYQGASDEPTEDVKGGCWSLCDPQTASSLSGVGYFFARTLHEYLGADVPVALVNTAMGGTYAECWIDAQTLRKTPSAEPYLQKAASEIVPGKSDVKGYWGEDNFRRPSALFNGKVAPLRPFAASGVIWYQGEGNSQKWLANGYKDTLSALIKSWRNGWRDDLPFLIVQLPRYRAGEGNDWPAVRAAQANAAKESDNTWLAVTIDLGYKDRIHPPDKQPVGERLAMIAAEKVYGKDVKSGPPFMVNAVISGDSLIVEFENGNGLYFKDGLDEGFEICGQEGEFIKADAMILPGSRVKIFSDKIKAPKAARYGWFNWGNVSLYNASGLPAAPFTTE